MEGTGTYGSTVLRSWNRNTDHEEALLGSMLLNEDAQVFCLPRLNEACFTHDRTRSLYRTLRDMFDEGERIDVVLVRTRTPSLDAVWLVDVQDACPLPTNYRHYLAAVIEDHDNRELAAAASTAAMQANAGNADAARGSWEEVQERLLAEDDDAARWPADKLMSVGIDVAEAYMTGERAVLGVASGFPSLDKYVSGLVPGNVIVVAARPGKGKSLFGSNVMVNVAKAGHEVALFSLEMTAQEVAMRVLCREAKVNWQALRDGKGEEATPLLQAAERLDSLPMTVIDDPRISLGALHSYCRSFHPEVVIVDYVQLMAGTVKDSRQEEVSAISRGLKLLAKERDVCVIALAQLNRNIEMRGDGASPQLSDLRDSGSLEQDADVVCFLMPTEARWLHVNIAKNRNGPPGQFRLAWTRAIGDMEDVDMPLVPPKPDLRVLATP